MDRLIRDIAAAIIIAIIATIVLALATSAHAETLHRGKVHKTTADKIIAERQLVCTYAKGSTRVEHLPDGRMVVIDGKVCVEVSR